MWILKHHNDSVQCCNRRGILYVSVVHAGVKTTQKFVGCVRDLKIEDSLQDMTTGQTFGKVRLDTCPTN